MAQAIQKITLSAARDIPFNKLILSQQNVRKIKAGVSIEDLARDIAHRGLLSSLNVRAELDADGKETGVYRIPAGGRRYRALELLVGQKRLAKTAGVPCIVSAGETSEVEDSLAENAQRVDLHPLDQYRAFQALRDQGIDEETIADRFFVSVQIVRQRLRLASVSPHLLELYANDEMSREQVMAFSITNDHARQEQVWEAVSRSQMTEARYIRRLLTETSVRATDRRAVYVGIDAYEATGGIVMRDLFEQDSGGWLQDPATLEQLVFEKLKADAEALKAEEGWKWVEAALDFPYNHSAGLRRFYGEQAEMTQAELDRHDTLKAEYEKLDADYAEAEDYSEETERRLEELGAEIDKLSDRPYVFKPEDVACGGAFVSLAANGELRIERGFVRPEDEPQIDTADVDTVNSEADDGEMPASSSASGISVNGQTVSNEEAEEEDDTVRPLPDRLVIDLTAARSVAMRNALANDPLIAFIAVLHAFVLKTFYLDTADSCLELTLQSATFSQSPGLSDTVWAREIDQRRQAWGQDLPKSSHDLWDFLIALDDASRQALFAHCASLSLNAVIEPWRKRPGAMTHVEQIARSIGFDMVGAGWTPTVGNYLGRVTKAHILQAVREARDERSVQLIDHLRKADMAREAERLLVDTGWIPELLRFSADEAPADASETVNAESDVDDSGDDAAVGDIPAFLTDEEAIIDVSEDPDDDGEHQHLDAAE